MLNSCLFFPLASRKFGTMSSWLQWEYRLTQREYLVKEIDVQSCVSLMWKWLGNSNWRHAKLWGKCILSKPTNHPTHHYKLLQTLKANHLSVFFYFCQDSKKEVSEGSWSHHLLWISGTWFENLSRALVISSYFCSGHGWSGRMNAL